MARLTRQEMWDVICSKYSCLNVLKIESIYNSNASYVHRSDLFKILLQMNIHQSRHLTKEQKLKVKEEININIIKKI